MWAVYAYRAASKADTDFHFENRQEKGNNSVSVYLPSFLLLILLDEHLNFSFSFDSTGVLGICSVLRLFEEL